MFLVTKTKRSREYEKTLVSRMGLGLYPSTTVVEFAIDCDKEAREVQPEIRISLEALLKQSVEDLDSE